MKELVDATRRFFLLAEWGQRLGWGADYPLRCQKPAATLSLHS